jgi:hypothetical protein
MPSLYELTWQYQKLFDLALQCEDDDQQPFIDTMEGLEGEIEQKFEALCKVKVSVEAQWEGLKTEIARLQARAKTASNNIDRIKNYIFVQMQQFGTTKMKAGTFSLAIQNSPPSLSIPDEAKVPKEFIRMEPIIDRSAIKDAIKSGRVIDGCELAVGQHLRIR